MDKLGITEALSGRHLVLVGMMGAGKSTVGRGLARELSLPFADADEEIEAAAGRTISEIFEQYGEDEFRRLEREVIARILSGEQKVVATGGGAIMDPATRTLIDGKSFSVWLRARLDLLVARTERRTHRPLLTGQDTRATLRRLLEQREPFYRQADITVDLGRGAPGKAVGEVLAALSRRMEPAR